MKTVIAAVILAGDLAIQAQINAPVFISFTNTDGIFITNAEVRQVKPQGVVYSIPAGGGFVDFTNLSEIIRLRLGYNEDRATEARREVALRRGRELIDQRAALQVWQQREMMGARTNLAYPFQHPA